jgi:glycosyltransferase involved in cell wall biosynthesis
VGGIPEVVIDEKTGLLAPAGDVDALADRILRLRSDPALYGQMITLGRARAERVFSERQMHAQYVRLYDQMLAAR